MCLIRSLLEYYKKSSSEQNFDTSFNEVEGGITHLMSNELFLLSTVYIVLLPSEQQ
jgi:hypothetical protein